MFKSATYSKILIWVTLFSIAMAYLESAIVVYLRALMYPGGFDFPLVMVEKQIIITEVFREVSTIIILLAISIVTGKYFVERFAWFIYCFGVWDIFYYVFLKILIGWPESFMTWDVLFLVPVAWIGPVITPVITSFTMILLAGFIIWFSSLNIKVIIKWQEWILLVAGSLILIIGWSWDYTRFILKHVSISDLFSFANKNALYEFVQVYVPASFNWILYWVGELVILSGIGLFFFRYRKEI
jgi:hypothetical protein